MMTDRASCVYIGWLADQVKPNRRRNFDELLWQMHATEFVYVVANDENRVQDAHDVRLDYFRQTQVKSYVGTDTLGPISVLEIMVALSRRMGFITEEPPEMWAWVLLQNLELDKYSGRISRRWAEEIAEILERLIWRQYPSDGMGGFFPLAWPEEDQQTAELWNQMHAYLTENEDPHD